MTAHELAEEGDVTGSGYSKTLTMMYPFRDIFNAANILKLSQLLHLKAWVVVSDSSSIASPHWRALFTDPYLVTLIEQGLANNTDYLAAGLRVQVVEAQDGPTPLAV